MNIDYSNIIESDIKDVEGLDETARVNYPTGWHILTKKEILCKLSEIEFKMNATWTPEFLDEFDEKYKSMNASELAEVLRERLTEVYNWDENAYYKVLG